MCEKRHCTHSPEELCSCAPVRSGDVLQTAAHVAESIMDINWELDYKSLADLGDYRLCLIGKCRQCGGRLCVSLRRHMATSCWPCLTRRPHEKTRWRTRIEQYRKTLRYL